MHVAGWARIKVKPTTMRRHGGDLSAAIEAATGAAREQVRELVISAVSDVVQTSVAKAGPGTQRDGWPIGPERPWDASWRGHSYKLFTLKDESRGWFVRIVAINPAGYAMFIHEPGNKGRIVWEREIQEPFDEGIKTLRPAIAKAIRDAIVRSL